MNLLKLIDEIEEDKMDFYLTTYDSDILEEFVVYLYKCQFNDKQVKLIFTNDILFRECYSFFSKTKSNT